jgi:hypothetical protein
LAPTTAAGIALKGVLARVCARRGIIRIIFSKHVAELIRGSVHTPELIGPRDELSLGVPALHPRNAIVEAEEANLNRLATGVLDFAMSLAHPVVGIQEVAFENLGVLDSDGLGHADDVLGSGRLHGEGANGSSIGSRGNVGRCIFIGCNKVPASTGDVLVIARNGRVPVLSLPGRSF